MVANGYSRGEGVTSPLLAGSPLDRLDEASEVAERLILLVHLGRDFTIWGKRPARYWKALTDHVRTGTYAGPGLEDWWGRVCSRMQSEPRSAEARGEVAELLTYPNHRAVLEVLRDRSAVLVLRVQVIMEHTRTDTPGGAGQGLVPA